MDSVIIRALNMNDAPGIQNIHRSCDDPWHDPAECRAWLERRLESGFYIQAAELSGRIVGHGELLIDDSPGERFLYLGMLQIDEDFQGLGIGRKMLDDAARYARKNNCKKIVTIPDSDNTSIKFYEKCGFIKNRLIKSCTVTSQENRRLQNKTEVIPEIPRSVPSEIPFVFGLAQASPRHMWEICNRKPATDDRKTPAIIINGTAYAQLSYFDDGDTALALLWSAFPTRNDIETIKFFARKCGLASVSFRFFEEYEYLFAGLDVVPEDIEIYKPVF